VDYIPNAGFVGTDEFEFQVDDSISETFATGLVSIVVRSGAGGDCNTSPSGCDDGR
jgi:hypothetical protein